MPVAVLEQFAAPNEASGFLGWLPYPVERVRGCAALGCLTRLPPSIRPSVSPRSCTAPAPHQPLWGAPASKTDGITARVLSGALALEASDEAQVAAWCGFA